MNLDPYDEGRFLQHLRNRASGRCWEWTGGATSFGHGRFKVKGRMASTHRIAFAIWKGDEIAFPGRDLVPHSYDNPRCCNPGHRRLGSHANNMRDAIQSARSLAALVGRTDRGRARKYASAAAVSC